MTNETNAPVRPFTLNDIEVGSRLYEALVHHARATQGAPIIYGDLLALARSLHPDDEVLRRAVPVGIGMKLLFVQAFCDANGYPNLACLAVNRQRRRPGPGYTGDWEADKRAVAAFDWSTANARLAAYASATRAAVPKRRPRIIEAEARDKLFAHFRAHRAAYAGVTLIDKEEIVNLLREGLDEDSALRQVLDAKSEFGEEPSA
jgi:hypothetical protein